MRRIGIRITGFFLLFMISVLSTCLSVRAEETEADITEDITEEEAEAILENETPPPDLENTAEEIITAAGGFKSIRNPALNVSYDSDSGSFIYRMPNDGVFSMNVPLGGITDKKVLLQTGVDTWITSYTEDGESAFKDDTVYNSVSEALAAAGKKEEKSEVLAERTGSFDFRIMSLAVNMSAMTSCLSSGSFRIVSTEIPLWINRLSPPYGYKTGTISIDGREYEKGREAADGSMELTKDGVYEVTFVPEIEGLPVWVSRFTRDTTAPTLTFNVPLTDEVIKEEVRFYPDESDSYIQVFLNNMPVALSSYTASAAGDYRIEVSDRAGNENVYSFSIKPAEKAHPYIYLFIGVFLVAAAALVVLTAHRRMRIL